MTTGEKLAKLRKENGYTQENLADKLGVSRQSISKWESDGAFPETEKLIQLSRLYNCSIDYLLKPEVEEERLIPVNSNTQSNNLNLKKYLTKSLYTSLWSIGIFVLMLLFYLIPVTRTVTVSIFGEMYFNVNMYQLIGSSNYSFWNYINLIVLLMEISMSILGIVIYLINSKKLYIARKILSYIVVIIWIIFMVALHYIKIGIILIVILALINALGLTFLKFNKYQEE